MSLLCLNNHGGEQEPAGGEERELCSDEKVWGQSVPPGKKTGLCLCVLNLSLLVLRVYAQCHQGAHLGVADLPSPSLTSH